MPRARNLKHEFFTNERLADLDPYTRLLFPGLWTLADREGRLEYRPRKIRAQVFPYEPEIDVEARLEELYGGGFIDIYRVGSTWYIQIVHWHDHQSPHPKEKESALPGPDEAEERYGETGESSGNAAASQVKERHSNGTPEVSDSKGPLKGTVEPRQSREINPDVLIPDSNPSDSNPSEELRSRAGSPDPPSPENQQRLNGARQLTEAAKRILGFLNEKTGRNFQPVDANLRLIRARIKEYDEKTVRQVTSIQCYKWLGDDKMEPYVRPKTLYNATNFAQYAGELKSAGAKRDE